MNKHGEIFTEIWRRKKTRFPAGLPEGEVLEWDRQEEDF
jgi:hypothetical protein